MFHGILKSTILTIILILVPIEGYNSAWTWECVDHKCVKRPQADLNITFQGLSSCRLICLDAAGIWPKPTGTLSYKLELSKVDTSNITVVTTQSPISDLLNAAIKYFKESVSQLEPTYKEKAKDLPLLISIKIVDENQTKLTLNTDESYTLGVSYSEEQIIAYISAETFFGGRHGLETLSQLIIYDDVLGEARMLSSVNITDKPIYKHRGVLLDTARSYVNVETIKRTLKAMGASKLNTFHWHITDSQSFPYVSKTRSELSQLGAYSPSKVYDAEVIDDIIRYGLEYGVKIIPEFDAPAHVGEGWQNTGLVVCFNKQPWSNFCSEPPCGQVDPTNEDLYNFLGDIYGDMLQQFDPDIFHMGGDEVNYNCWNSTDNIVQWMDTQGWNRTLEDFLKLWSHFQNKALEKVYEKSGKKIPVVLWTSDLTKKEYILNYLPKDQYIIQVWTNSINSQLNDLLDEGYNVIISNYDALYLDCGFGSWTGEGNNWCSPYIGWQKIYENKIYKLAGNRTNQVLGAEAALWTEQADSAVVDSRLWPRAAALAEVLWSEPHTTWREAELRFLAHRKRLITKGIHADAVEPEWCFQNENSCT